MLFNLFGKKEFQNHEIIAPVKGQIIENDKLNDPIFSQQMLGQTLAIRPSLDYLTIVAPANGVLEVLFPTGHAFAVRMENGLGLLVHVGINTVDLKGKGFKILAKKGQQVKAGDPIVKVDFNFLQESGLDYEVMLIVTDYDGKIDFQCQNFVKSKEKIAEVPNC